MQNYAKSDISPLDQKKLTRNSQTLMESLDLEGACPYSCEDNAESLELSDSPPPPIRQTVNFKKPGRQM